MGCSTQGAKRSPFISDFSFNDIFKDKYSFEDLFFKNSALKIP
jgi:hypothetical protein